MAQEDVDRKTNADGQTGGQKGGKNFEDDTDLLFLSGFPVWAKL